MDEKYRRYYRTKFRQWKERVNKYLPQIAISLYAYKLEGNHIPYEKEKLLGNVIAAINNPFYSLQDGVGKRYDYNNEMAVEILLLLQVNELFSFVKTKCHPVNK